tara:strand:+ start:659 stop:1942 length:1284 start_codon:yes stop_codon:yes gene_type:complete
MEAVGKLTNGELVFMRRTGKNSYRYADKDGNKVDGRKVKKFSKNTTNKGATSVEAEKMKKKTTPKPSVKQAVIKKEKKKQPTYEEMTKEYLKKNPMRKNESVKEYERDKAKAFKKMRLNIEKREMAEFIADQKSKGIYKPTKSVRQEIHEENYNKYLEDYKKKRDEKKNTPKPSVKQAVIKNEIIEKKEEPPVKQAPVKQAPAKQGKQTEEQLAKRRAKYQENRAKELARKKAYREANKDKIDKYQEQYRASAKGKAYQKAYREENSKIPEPKRTKAEVEAGVKAFGLPKGQERYAMDINKKIKEDKPRKVRSDKGKERGKYDRPTKDENLKKYPRPVRKSGESEEVYNVRRGLWEKVVGGRLPPSMLTMKNAVKVAYGDGITIGGKNMTTSEWIRKIEKETGRDIERDGLGVGNLKKADIDPDAVY